MCYDIDALLEELERSTLQDSDEYSNPAPLPQDQYSRKESTETSDIPSVQDDTSPLQVIFIYWSAVNTDVWVLSEYELHPTQNNVKG